MALNPLHHLWRALPRTPRREALRHAATMLAPRLGPAPPARAGVAVAGELARASGLGEGGRVILHALDRLGTPSWPAGPGLPMPPEGAPLILHANPAALPLAMLKLGRPLVRNRRIIGLWPWELATVPAAWRCGFRFVHEVWAPSRFSAAAIEAAMPPGFEPALVRVVPYPLASHPPSPAPLSRAQLGLPEACVLTLVVFNLASSFDRKNPLAAIAAHRRAFGARPDRLLLLRVGNPADFPADFARLQAAADLPNVVIETRTRPRDEAHAVMAAADIVMSLHRSEGFGLVLAEAMLLGKPVVATAWSGTEDFLDDAYAARVPARLVPARDSRGVFQAPGAVWAEPDIDAAAAWLARLADCTDERRRRGAAAKAAAQARFSAAPLAEGVRALGIPVPR